MRLSLEENTLYELITVKCESSLCKYLDVRQFLSLLYDRERLMRFSNTKVQSPSCIGEISVVTCVNTGSINASRLDHIDRESALVSTLCTP